MHISMSDIDPRQRLLHELERAAALKARSAADPQHAARRAAFRLWQAARLTRTHAALLDSARYHDAAIFFLNDLYGPDDVAVQVEDIKRIVPLMMKTLPSAAVGTVADAIELDALSEELDAAMIDWLGERALHLSAADYGEAYRAVGRRADRTRQIDLIEHLGNSLDGLTRLPLIGTTLRLMRKPAQAAGFGALQSFLERGYAAFKTMRSGSEFVAEIVGHERAISDALFAGEDSVVE
jgi:hypothetical protein